MRLLNTPRSPRNPVLRKSERSAQCAQQRAEIGTNICHSVHTVQSGQIGVVMVQASFARSFIGVQCVEAVMGGGEPRGEIQFAADDLDVARRFARGGPGQRSIELAKRGDFGREPTLAA